MTQQTNLQALCAEQLPELRGMFERILCVARSSDGPIVGHIQLADQLIDAVVSWSENSLAQPEPEGVTDRELGAFFVEKGLLYATESTYALASVTRNVHGQVLARAFREALNRYARPTTEPVPVAERLPELRGMFERILCVARSSGGLTVGNIQLADRLIDAVVSWSGDALPVPGAEVG
jgi:hypothetical protein